MTVFQCRRKNFQAVLKPSVRLCVNSADNKYDMSVDETDFVHQEHMDEQGEEERETLSPLYFTVACENYDNFDSEHKVEDMKMRVVFSIKIILNFANFHDIRDRSLVLSTISHLQFM